MRFIPAALLIAAAGSFAVFSVAQDAPPGGAVEGVVINSVTGAGIGGASVELLGNQSNRYQTTSDVAGHFKLTGVTPGSYLTSVSKDGFTAPSFDVSPLNSVLRVASGDPVKLEFKLTPLHTVAGSVLGPDRRPAAGVEVSVYPNINADEAVTDEEGRFKLENIRSGSYTLMAKPAARAKPETATDGTRTAMVTTYYPSVADRSLSQPIVLGSQGDLGGDYEIRMQTATVYRVRGMVLDEDGKPSPGAELTLLPMTQGTSRPMGLSIRTGGLSTFALGLRPGPSGAPEATVIAGEDGRFEFPAVRSGDWRISVESDLMRAAETRGGVTERGKAAASVGRSDVDDLQIHIAMPFNLTGTIEWSGEDPGSPRDSNFQVLFSAVTLMSPDDDEFVRFGAAFTKRLLFDNILPGRYSVIVKPGLSAQVFLGDREVTGQTFSVNAGGPPLRVVLKTWSGTVRGTVERGDGATVVLFPQRFEGVTLGQSIVCGAGGSFEFSEVSPGDYYIAAFEHMGAPSTVPSTISASMLSLVPSRGTRVTVEERSAANVMLSVIAMPR
jgi:hypothetical protein